MGKINKYLSFSLSLTNSDITFPWLDLVIFGIIVIMLKSVGLSLAISVSLILL